MFDPLTACEDVEGNVQDMVRLVIREVHLEQVKIGVDVVDQARPRARRSMAPMPPVSAPGPDQ